MAVTVPKDSLRALFAGLAGVPASNVIWDGEPVPMVAPKAGQVQGLLTLDVVARRTLGVDEERRTYNPDGSMTLTLGGQRELVISLRADMYGSEEAFDLLENVRVGVGQDDVRASFRAAGVAFTQASNVQPLPGTVDNRAISVASLDFFFNQAVTKTVNVAADVGNWIETVEISGDDELDIAGTFEVTDPPDA